MHTALIDDILSAYQGTLGSDFEKYRNHACRVFVFAALLSKANEEEQKQMAIAAAFHDLGIWSAHTFDYLNPSLQLAEEYLIKNQLEHWITGVKDMISNHHKLTAYSSSSLVENFRKADLIDLTFGWVKFGIPSYRIAEYKKRYPAKGFQIFIFKKIIKNIIWHPLNPLPMVKW